MLIDVFYSDSTGRLLPGGSFPAPPSDSGCLPAGRTAFSDGNDDYSAYILTSCSIGSGRRLALRADVVRITPSQRREPPRDPLLGCLADLDDSIARIDSIDARSMADNLVTTTDHVTADKVLVDQLHFVPDGAIKIQVCSGRWSQPAGVDPLLIYYLWCAGAAQCDDGAAAQRRRPASALAPHRRADDFGGAQAGG